jgi:hypothetical protein
MNGAVHATAAQKGGIRRIDNAGNPQCRNISPPEHGPPPGLPLIVIGHLLFLLPQTFSKIHNGFSLV